MHYLFFVFLGLLMLLFAAGWLEDMIDVKRISKSTNPAVIVGPDPGDRDVESSPAIAPS